jgi:hypothetical protein
VDGVLIFQAGHAGSIPVARSTFYALKAQVTGMIADLDHNGNRRVERPSCQIMTAERAAHTSVSQRACPCPGPSAWPSHSGMLL